MCVLSVLLAALFLYAKFRYAFLCVCGCAAIHVHLLRFGTHHSSLAFRLRFLRSFAGLQGIFLGAKTLQVVKTSGCNHKNAKIAQVSVENKCEWSQRRRGKIVTIDWCRLVDMYVCIYVYRLLGALWDSAFL